MIQVTLAAVAVMLVTSSAVANDQQFNLVCNGTKSLDMTEAPTPYAVGFSVDLEKKQICLVPCKVVVGLTRMDPDVIEVRDLMQNEFPGPDISGILTISRDNGKLTWTRVYFGNNNSIDSINKGWFVEAACTKAPFTGFPSNSF